MPCTPLADIAGQANRAVVGGTKAESRHFLLEAKWELRYVPLTIGICAMPSDAEFTVRPDAKGRVTLGALAKGVSSYRISKEADGRLLLEPDRKSTL